MGTPIKGSTFWILPGVWVIRQANQGTTDWGLASLEFVRFQVQEFMALIKHEILSLWSLVKRC